MSDKIRGTVGLLGGSGGGGATGTIGAAVPATASPAAVKDNAGNLAYPNLDGSGNLLVAVTGAGSGGTSSVDGAGYTAGTTAGTPMLGAVDDTGTTAAAEDKVGIVRITPQRAIHANLRKLDGTELGISTAPLRVDPTGTTTQPTKSEAQLDYDTGGGTQNLSLHGIALPAAGGAVAGGTSTNPVRVDPTGTTTQPISAAALPLPAGAATSAKQPGLGTAGSAHPDVITVQGVASGTVLPVSAAELTTLAGAVRAEDAASADGHTGIPALAVRKAAPANTSGTDGDYENLQISAGRLWASATIDAALPAGANAIGKLAANSGVIIGDVNVVSEIPGTGATALGKAEDAVAASGDTGVAVLAVRRDAAASGVSADGDYANLSVDSNGALRVTGGGGGTQYNVDDVASATATGTFALAVRKDSGASLAGTDGDVTALQVDASGALRVTGGGGGTEYTEDAAAAANPVGQMMMFRRKDTLSASEVSADGDNIAANATSKGELYVKHTDSVIVAGDIASGSADSGLPVKIGAKGTRARASDIGADGRRANLTSDRYGRLTIAGIDLTIAAIQATASGDTSLVGAPGASTRIKLVRIEASNSHATTALTVGIKSTSLNGGSTFGKKYLPAIGGQAVWNFPGGHLMCGVNEAVNINLSAAGQIEVTAYYETVAD